MVAPVTGVGATVVAGGAGVVAGGTGVVAGGAWVVAPGARQVAVQTAPGPPWLLLLEMNLTVSFPFLVDVSGVAWQNLAKPSVDDFIKNPYEHLVFFTVLTMKKSLLPLHLALAAVRAKASQEKFSSHLFLLARCGQYSGLILG